MFELHVYRTGYNYLHRPFFGQTTTEREVRRILPTTTRQPQTSALAGEDSTQMAGKPFNSLDHLHCMAALAQRTGVSICHSE